MTEVSSSLDKFKPGRGTVSEPRWTVTEEAPEAVPWPLCVCAST